ncbi:MAG: ABC transporter permease [Gammaproteobacteria bacterium]
MSARDIPLDTRPSPVTRATGVKPALLRFARALPISGRLGLALVTFWLVVALLGPYVAPHAVGAMVSQDVYDPISAQFPLGSDYLGRDMLSRVLHGARFTVGLAFAAALLASTTGLTLALFAAVSGRWIDEVTSRIMDTLISIPSKIFALVVVAAFGSAVPLLLVLAAITYVPGAFRIARALATNVNAMEFVQAARARGEGRFYIARAEILPNMIHPMLADFGLRFLFIVLLLSGLSFLGLGVQPPNADLGSLVRENMSGIIEAAPAVIAPALAIATLTIGVNLLIDALPGSRRNASEHG